MSQGPARDVLLVPPHADFTLAWTPPEGFEAVDAARGFVMRALAPARLAVAATARAAGLPSGGAEAGRALLLLRAAGALLTSGADVHTHLRACGAALAGLSAPPCPVRLRLDDLELPDGTTERSEDVLRAAGLPGAPYEEDLAAAVEACAGAGRVRLRLDRDQQLPAALALAEALEGGHRLEVTGPFAAAHWATLERLTPLREAALVPDDALPSVAGSPLRLSPEPGLRWVDDPYQLHPPPAGPWGGAIPFAALADPERLLASGCRLLVLGFCELGDEAVGADGAVLGRDALLSAVARLRGAGVRLVGEWWIGAPGIGEDALERTLAAIEQALPFDGLSGVRAFHWPAARESGRWGRVDVAAGPLPEGRDLARARPFSAPGTLSPQAAAEKLQALAQRLSRAFPLSPGRVAQAAVVPPPPRPPAGGGKVCLDPDCAVVELPASLEGRPGPAWYAANLRTGLVLAMDPRLAPSLQLLRAPVLPGEALPRVPEAQRAKLVRMLVDKAVMREVAG